MADLTKHSDGVEINVTKSMPWYWLLWRLIPHSHGTDNMVMVEKLPDTFGAYEIWTCTKCKFTEAI